MSRSDGRYRSRTGSGPTHLVTNQSPRRRSGVIVRRETSDPYVRDTYLAYGPVAPWPVGTGGFDCAHFGGEGPGRTRATPGVDMGRGSRGGVRCGGGNMSNLINMTFDEPSFKINHCSLLHCTAYVLHICTAL